MSEIKTTYGTALKKLPGFNPVLAGIFGLSFALVGVYVVFSSHAAGCTQTLTPASNITAAVQNAAGDSTICLTAGQYPALTLQGLHTTDVTLTNAPGDKVVVGSATVTSTTALDILPNTSHLAIRNLYLSGGINIGADRSYGASYITIDHNDIAPVGLGINAGGINCTVPNGPSCTATSDKYITNITISGNRIHYPKTTEQLAYNIQQDALHFNNYDGLSIVGNEITNVVAPADGDATYSKAHNDCFQSVYGGSNLTFDRNYEHDNNCQGFFIKDGDVTNVNLSNNLFVRNRVNNAGENTVKPYNVHNFVARNNTDWSDNSELLRVSNTATTYDATIDHNVIQSIQSDSSMPATYRITASYNIFRNIPNFASDNSMTGTTPAFINSAADDYRLATNPNGIGVNWKSGDYIYGPIDIGSTPTATPPSPAPAPAPAPVPAPQPAPTPAPAPDTTGPDVTIQSPSNGSNIRGTVTISASATDNTEVASVEIYIDGKLYASSASDTLITTWSTKTKRVARGSHTIMAKSKDSSGNVGSNTILVNVVK